MSYADDLNEDDLRDEVDDDDVGSGRRAGLRADERDPDETAGPEASAAGDIHAVGTPGGGLASGGLGGTNAGDGSPTNVDIDETMGSGILDTGGEDEEDEPYAGPGGGSVGGTPSGKRARGGNIHRGISAGGDYGGDNTIGTDPHRKS